MADEAKQNIWDFAIATSKEIKSHQPKPNTLLFVGSKGGGKSSLINRFIDRNEDTPSAVALDYTFAKRKGSKDVCDVWELGGGTLLTNLLEFVITPQLIPQLAIIIVVDLSKLEEMISTLDTLVDNIRERVDTLVSSEKSYLVKETLRQKARSRVGEKHEDISAINPSLVPLLIVGSKYDIFQSLESDRKKVINRFLRLTAHFNGASLVYTSIRSEVTMTRIRTLLSSLSFSTTENFDPVFDFNKPLLIPFGSDNFQIIGVISVEAVKKDLSDLYPHQEAAKFVIPDNPAADPKFKEKDIDLVRAVRDQELEEYRRQIELNTNFESRNSIS